ncbi:MAG: CDP-diacylglycerol--serine O-phosphatidyltransferase [Bacteroidales bacterium]|jgi:CDP-diacylglycerol--serine O-phosphatidyltransferase|nr:CDP-diacylglycerol--serine O-phosphatidyltransferase [Bacteroidales bacterium]
MKRHIPNFITSLNLAAGFISIIFAFRGETALASWLIMAAMAFDFLDGFTARLLGAYSETGKELDSLADVVSFGVAPAIIIFILLEEAAGLSGTSLRMSSGGTSPLLLLITLIMPVCAALRLAKFNVDPGQKTSFRGLPTPANALAVTSLVLAEHYGSSSLIDSMAGSAAALIIFTVLISLLMVTRLPLLSLKTNNLRFRGNEKRYALVAIVIMALAIFGISGATLIIPAYIAVSLVPPLAA